MTVVLTAADELDIAERVIVAPALGVFEPLPPETVAAEGEIVRQGQAVGTVTVGGEKRPVCSAFSGFLMGMLAAPGERVREGQPVAWLRTF